MSSHPNDDASEMLALPAEPGGFVTRMETLEEVRHALAKAQRVPTAKDQNLDDTLTFRPVRRPPMAVLTILDDGSNEGEKVRLRTDRVVIGRTEGDILIPHDAAMSSKHAELVRQFDHGHYRWMLTDLKSMNGSYVRLSSTLLKHGQELLIGGRRYRFDAAPQGASIEDSQTPIPASGTCAWQAVGVADLLPSLVELSPEGDGKRHAMRGSECWIGRDPHCSILLADDPLVSPRHARIFQDGKGRWNIENVGARNGTWTRINRMPFDSSGFFQLGEQRFHFKVRP